MLLKRVRDWSTREAVHRSEARRMSVSEVRKANAERPEKYGENNEKNYFDFCSAGLLYHDSLCRRE